MPDNDPGPPVEEVVVVPVAVDISEDIAPPTPTAVAAAAAATLAFKELDPELSFDAKRQRLD